MPISLHRRPTRRPKRAAQNHAEHSLIEVTSIIRQRPFTWVADVEYTYGRTSWNERLQFVLNVTREGRFVTVSDADFPHDRRRVLVIDGSRDMPQLILDFVIAGRW
jgi:hypothetical protein